MTSEKEKKKFTTINAVRNYYDMHAPKYDADYEDAGWQLYDDLTWAFIEPYLPTDKTTPILDCGGGTAKWAIKMAELGYSVICGDISQGMLDIAQQKITAQHFESQIQLRMLDIRNMEGVPDATYNLVLAVGDVISYAMDEDLAVAEMYRVCKPGGYAIASVDNKLTYIINEINYDHWDHLDNFIQTGVSNFFSHHPIKAFFPKELGNLFTRHGFDVVKIVGKPVITTMMSKKERRQKLQPNYKQVFELEKRFADDPAFIGHGGHLQIIVHKPMR